MAETDPEDGEIIEEIDISDEELAAIATSLPAADTLKAGARNSRRDQTRLQTIHDYAVENGAVCAAGKGDNALKAIAKTDDELRVGNYILLFGDPEHRDLEGVATPRKNKDGSKGEYFTPAVDVESEYTKSGTLHVDWEHGDDPERLGSSADNVLGFVDWKTARRDERGIFVERVLNRRNKYVQWLEELIVSGLVGNSSMALPGKVEKKADGGIVKWPLKRDTLTVNPMEPRMLSANQLQAMKALHLVEEQPQAPGEGAADTQPSTKSLKEFDMDENEVKGIVAAALKADREAREAEAKAQADYQAKVDAAVKAEREKWEAEAAKSRRLPYLDGKAPLQAQYADTAKYDHLSAAELGLAIDVQNEIHAKAPTKMAAVSNSAVKALMLKVARIDQDKESPETSAYAKSALKAVIGDLGDEAIKAATDPAYSTLASAGADWVGTAYSNQLWESIRMTPRIVGKLPTKIIPDGYSSETFPLEGADPVWYKVPEVTAANATTGTPDATIPASQMGTGNKSITIGKMGCRGMYSGELTEDSLISYVPQLRAQIATSGQEMLEHLVIDGDTATAATTNINDIGNGSTQASTSFFTILDGFRKLALVTNTANSRAGGALDEDDYLETMWLMGTAGMAGADLSKCGFIIDPNVYKQSLKMATVKTKDVWTNATVESGVLTKIWGYEILPSWFMHNESAVRKTNIDGKVNKTDTSLNLYGAILGVRWDQWKLAFKRRMTMETTRIANADAWEIVALARWGLGYRDTEAAAITYGLSV